MVDLVDLTSSLVRFPSITPNDHGCQDFLIQFLMRLGFNCEKFLVNKVSNLLAIKGVGEPLIMFAGHTDVVPPGDLTQWQLDPFNPCVIDDYLYGRGVADMKGGIAAMLCACEEYLLKHPKHGGSIGFMITSGEESLVSLDGTPKIMEKLKEKRRNIKWCILGEPTSDKITGDTIKIGRRGSLSAHIKVYGEQGHVAYPHLADNPIHKSLEWLNKVISIELDKGDEYFQPTKLQIVYINSGINNKEITNVIPGVLELSLNIRFNPYKDVSWIKEQVNNLLSKSCKAYDIDWVLAAYPYLTKDQILIGKTKQVIKDIIGFAPAISTVGGASDGGFIAQHGVSVIELGVPNQSIHKVNERTKISDLFTLKQIYANLLTNLLNNK